jgi:hypothetical protein
MRMCVMGRRVPVVLELAGMEQERTCLGRRHGNGVTEEKVRGKTM